MSDDTEARLDLADLGYDLRMKGRAEPFMTASKALRTGISAVYQATGAAILEDLLRDQILDLLVDNALSPNSDREENYLAAVLLSLKEDGEW